MYEELKKYKKFIEKSDTDTELSSLWTKYKNDFSTSLDGRQEELRGYPVNKSVSNNKIFFYFRLKKIFSKIISLFIRFSNKIEKFSIKILSISKKNHTQFAFNSLLTILETLRKDKSFKTFQIKVFKKLKWNLSYNSFKNSFYYYNLIANLPKDFKFNTCLEIGSGLLQFAMLNLINREKLVYICVDIEEMIPSGYISLKENYPNNDITIFLPNQISEFNKSESDKKVLFITPKQYDNFSKHINLKIDLLINIESFAEMKISTVNKYLDKSINYLNNKAFLFTVNRLARLVNRSNRINPLYSDFTLFSDYNLKSFNPIKYEVDSLRSHLHGIEKQENILFLGEFNIT